LLLVHNGQEAINYLTGAGDYGNRDRYPLPALVILDLKMPLISGLDVLRRLRAHADLDELPVIVLVCSNEDNNVETAMDLGATGYIVKPPSGKALLGVIRHLGEERFDLERAKRRTEAALTRPSQE
jgi:CheY-like chemotaxis protein